MRVLVASACLLLLAACGGNSPPDVDWSRVPANQRVGIDDAVKAKDCERMQAAFDGSRDADVLEYLDWQMEHAGCY
jgi:hypothetical protein